MRLQVLKLFGAMVMCQVCEGLIYIADAEIDHELALVDGGSHDWSSNMRPLCRECHSRKSAKEHQENCRAKRRQKKHTQPTQPGSIKSRGFDKTYRKKMNGQTEKRT
jgi:5-methylcytosine-specific restriction endonuclease McrA